MQYTTEDVCNILSEIVKTPIMEEASNSVELQCALSSLEKIYSEENFRHSYFEISKKLEEFRPEERDTLTTSLEIILALAENRQVKKSTITNIFKLSDHVSLENLRLNRMDALKHIERNIVEISKNSKIESENTMNQAKGVVSKVKKAQKKIKNLQRETVAVLGIFASIIVVFSTETGLLYNSFASINEMNFYKIILYAIVVGLIGFNTIFLLLYGISKITGSSIAARCRENLCSECELNGKNGTCKNIIRKCLKKYPYYVLINFLFVVIFLAVICLTIIMRRLGIV